MINAKLYKKILGYLIDICVCACIAFSLLCFVEILWPGYTYVYILSSIILTYILYFVFVSFILKISKGKSLGYAIFGLRLVIKQNKPLHLSQILIKNSIEGFPVCVLIDAIFTYFARTEIGAIERVSNTFIIDER